MWLLSICFFWLEYFDQTQEDPHRRKAFQMWLLSICFLWSYWFDQTQENPHSTYGQGQRNHANILCLKISDSVIPLFTHLVLCRVSRKKLQCKKKEHRHEAFQKKIRTCVSLEYLPSSLVISIGETSSTSSGPSTLYYLDQKKRETFYKMV